MIKKKKLSMRIETIRQLAPARMALAVGGQDVPPTINNITCVGGLGMVGCAITATQIGHTGCTASPTQGITCVNCGAP